MSAGKRFSGDEYGEGYWERAEGSNYRDYGDDPGWGIIADIFQRLRSNARVIEAACAKGYFVAALRDKLMDA